MEADANLFSSTVIGWAVFFYAAVFIAALRLAPWLHLRQPGQLHVFLGACVALLFLWLMRADIHTGFSYHLLGVTSVTLMFGWSFGIIITSLVLAGVVFNAGSGWENFALNIIFIGVVPVTLTQIFLVLIRSYLPKHFIIYVMLNAFLTAGLVGSLSGIAVVSALILNESYTWFGVKQNILPFFPLMFLPEALINGWVMTVLVSLKPEWVYSFNDEQYLRGK